MVEPGGSAIPLNRIDDYRWEIPRSYRKGMRVPGLIFADEKLLKTIRADRSLEQVANVAHLPGIVRYSMAMPDIHGGYGFPIGGVAATDPDEGGVISPGGVGYDINCGVAMLRTTLSAEDLPGIQRELIQQLFNHIPCGVGQSGDIHVSKAEMRKVAREGSLWAVRRGYGTPTDLRHTEAGGALQGADPEAVSDRAYERGQSQLGTLGSGNHFLEVQVVDEVFDPEAANDFHLRQGQVTVMIHSGSRGFGYQICDDSLEATRHALSKYRIDVPDAQLSCAPIDSPEGRQYLAVMRAAANFAWANRLCLIHLAREVFEKIFARSYAALGMDLIYDVAHNIAQFERYEIDGEMKTLCVHRKGATRAFGPGNADLPEEYRASGQPVIIPGDMGRASYLLAGRDQAMKETFGTCCHGAGREMSRSQAVKDARGRSIEKELEEKGIVVIGRGHRGIAEEQPRAYKDVNDVVRVVHEAGIARKVVRLRPIGAIKG